MSSLYGAIAARRRAWYSADPSRQRHLSRPVISVGNLRAGGAGKTPVVLELARLLAARGERPAILSRGYAREVADDGVTVVSDGTRVIADLAHAGDEPLMLARALPGCPVLVCGDRHLAGCLAERRLGATLHVLDDGFQHFRLARDLDLLVVDGADLEDRLLPAGRLREPIDAAAFADALITASDDTTIDAWRRRVPVPIFRIARTPGSVRMLVDGTRHDTEALKLLRDVRGAPAFALAGIARPERFFDDLAASGWTIAGHEIFADHHRYTNADLDRVVARARAAGARMVLTTEKDAVRLEHLRAADLPFAAVGLNVALQPACVDWIVQRLAHRAKNADVTA